MERGWLRYGQPRRSRSPWRRARCCAGTRRQFRGNSLVPGLVAALTCPSCPAELSRINPGLDLELLEGVHRRLEDVRVEVDVGVGDSVQREVLPRRAPTGNSDGHIAARATQPATRLSGGNEPSGHIGTQGDQAEVTPAIQGQLGNSRLLNHGADCRVFGGQHSRIRLDLHGFRGLPQFQCEIDAGSLLHLQLDVAGHSGLEARRRGLDLVHSRRQAGETIDPGGVAGCGSGHIGRRIGGRYGCVRDQSTTLVLHFARDFAGRLGQRPSGESAHQNNQD